MTKKLYLCLKEIEPNPPPGGPIAKEEIYTYKWYSIDPVEGTDGLTTFIPPALNPLPNDQPGLFGCCALGSEIYVVGGAHFSHWGDDEPYVPGRHPLKLTFIERVLVCDVNFPISGWKEMPDHMKSKRARPQVCVIDEKIYVFGSNIHPSIPPCNPWAEVFDRQKGWKTLDDPPLELFNYFTGDPFETIGAMNHAVLDKNDIAVRLHSFSFNADLCFKTKSLKWEDMDPRCWPYELFYGCGCQKYVVLDDSETKHQVVYAVINGDLCTCKLDQQEVPKIAKIPGLEEVTKSIKGE